MKHVLSLKNEDIFNNVDQMRVLKSSIVNRYIPLYMEGHLNLQQHFLKQDQTHMLKI